MAGLARPIRRHPDATAAIERANHAFRAVKLEPGRHEVELRYEPRSVRVGLAVSLLAAGVTVLIACPRRASRQVGETS